jgi:hypothetical protein
MLRKRNILFIISAIVLIPILLSLTPVKLVQKLGSGCPFAHSKTVLSCTPCMYNSVTSQSETGSLTLAALPSVPFVSQPMSLFSGGAIDPDVTIVSNPFSEAPPLRC